MNYKAVEEIAKSIDMIEKEDGSIELTMTFDDKQTKDETDTIKAFLLEMIRCQRCNECEDSYYKNNELYCELKEMPVDKIDCPLEA